MILDRMTTLLRNQFSEIKNELQKEFEARGLRLSATDIAALLEEISPKGSRVALGYALDYLRPFSMGMGFRIARLSETQVEMIIPFRFRNKNESGSLHEATLLPAAIEAANIFWQRHIDGSFQIYVTAQKSKWIKPLFEDARLRFETPKSQREFILAQLRENTECPIEIKFQVYDASEILVAETELKLILKKTLTLGHHSSKVEI